MRLSTMFITFATAVMPLSAASDQTVDAQAPIATELSAVQINLELNYYVFNQDVTSFFQTLERDTNLRFKISPNVRGRLLKVPLQGHPGVVIGEVAQSLSLDWYEFNDIIHVSQKSESGTRVVRLGDLTSQHALRALKESGLPMDSLSAQVTGGGAALAISGPPSLLALAEAVIETTPDVQELAAIDLPQTPVRSVIVRRGVDTQLVPLR